MSDSQATETPHVSLATRVSDAIRQEIVGGTYPPGSRLPSESRLTQDFGVSRTVVREAIAALRADRLVESRQGAGVFVIDPPAEPALPFRNINMQRVSSLIEVLELRTAVEGDAAALAAQRCSPAQEEHILEALAAVTDAARSGAPTALLDYQFHLSVAEAANNPRFAELLRLLGPNLIPRRAVAEGLEATLPPTDLERILEEHRAIVSAIQDRDEDAARDAMRSHLRNSQARYRAMLRGRRG